MDTSETYVKMCEKAVEIQKYFYGLPLSKRDIHDFYKQIQGGGYITNVWLPRQDQLQEMVWKDFKLQLISHALMDFYNWAQSLFDELDDYESMEQLWLAFVMLQKYRKTWNGEDWIKTTLGG